MHELKSTDGLKLKILEESDITSQYLGWFLDNEVIAFSDNQYRIFTFKDQLAYIKESYESKNKDLYGIFTTGKHIGNIVIDGLLSRHVNAEISYMIGDKEYWGKGLASHAIAEIIILAKENYKLNKLYAGCANENYGSRKALEKNNFKIEGIRKQHLYYNNSWYDQVDYGLILS